MDAVGYTRLSQASDASITRQKRGIRDYCDRNGFDLLQIHDDGEFSSGFDVERSEYQTVRDRVAAGEIGAVVIYDHGARIGRDFDERMKFLLSLREYDVELHSEKRGHIDLSNPTDVAVEGIHAAKDDEAKREEIEKAREAVDERIANGCYQGTPPIGLEFADDGCHLQQSDRWDDVERAFALLEKDDMTLTDVASRTGIGVSTLSRMGSRGREWYDQRLEQYGAS